MDKSQNKNEEGDPIEDLKKNLYSRNFESDDARGAPKFKRHSADVPSSWEGEDTLGSYTPRIKEETPILGKLFIAAIAFFIVSILVAGFVFLGEKNIVSSDNVDIEIVGPVSIGGGEELSYQITIENQNNTALENAHLLLQYPEGTRRADDVTVELKRYREEIGTIEPGKSINKKVSAVLFGEEGSVKTIVVSVEYQVKGSNAIFPKDKPYEVVINSAPVTVTVESLKEVNSGQEFEFNVEIASNASALIKGLMVQAEYPFGFEFIGSSPQAVTSAKDTWGLGDLKPGAKKVIRVKGRLEGEDEEERTFRFSVGTEHPKEENVLGTAFLTSGHSVRIKKPFIGVNLALNSDTSKEFVAGSGSVVNGVLFWQNNLPTRITDAVIQVKLNGSLFPKTSVAVDQGFYRSLDNTIVWNQTNTSELAILNPGDSGQVDFSFRLYGLQEGLVTARSPEMAIEVSVKGKRVGDSQVPEEISSTLVRRIKLASDVGLSARVLHGVGPFANTGPLPPRADQATTYTVTLALSNSTNNLNNVKVRGLLPSYVKWLDKWSLPNEKVSYNPATGEVVWDVGSLGAGVGHGNGVKELSFQVSLTPSVSQVGSAPIILSDLTAIAEDRFANVQIQSEARADLTTILSTDPTYTDNEGIVAK